MRCTDISTIEASESFDVLAEEKSYSDRRLLQWRIDHEYQ
jgi:hypothetical protein